MIALRAALASLVVLVVPAVAQAGTVSTAGTTMTYQAGEGGEQISIGQDGTGSFMSFGRPVVVGSAVGCQAAPDGMRLDCTPPVTTFVVNLFGGSNSVDAAQATIANLEIRGGDGPDTIVGTRNSDRIDAGPGGGEIDDGPGDDTVSGGSGDDNWTAGTGRDTFMPGDGADTVSYEGRSAPVTITLDGIADDGEAGEGDNVGTPESATGGAGNDRIVGNDLGGYLYGRSGNDTIVAGRGEDRVQGDEGDDTIDTRDGRYDSIDCGAGNDTLYADPGDSATNCEVAPDVDGDGFLPPADCAPTNPAVHPGAGEIVGNDVDEDCSGGPGYLRVVSPVSFGYDRDRKRSRVRFTKFTIGEVKAGDRIEIRCKTGSKGCAFATKRITGGSKRSLNAVSYFKQRFLKRGAVVEVRSTRPNEIGAVRRLTVGKKGAIKSELLCLPPRASAPSRCT
jgi:Ca2+-binding RTX toxin-like protein